MSMQKLMVGVGLLAAVGAVTCFAERTPSLLERVIHIMGIDKSPGMARGGQSRVIAGEIRVATLDGGEVRSLAEDRPYRSPIFDRGDQSVLALSGDDLFRIPISGTLPFSKLQTVLGVYKLIGFQGATGDQILVLTSSQEVGLLSLSTFAFEPIAYDEESSEDRTMLRHIRYWNRTYDDGRFFLSIDQTDASAPWQVFLRTPPETESVNVSKCRRMNCDQPSMSHDRRRIVFVGQPMK